jgi:hypothetical protein
LWERLGRPQAYRYDYDVLQGTTTVTAIRPDELGGRLESEAEWPPLAVAAGWAHPDFRECLSGGQGLHLRGPSGTRATVEVVPPMPGRYELTLGWLADPHTEIELGINGSRISLVGSRDGLEQKGGCFIARAGAIELTGPTRVELRVRQDVIVDYLELTSPDAKKR